MCIRDSLKTPPAAAWADLRRIYMELHIRSQVPRGDGEPMPLGRIAERQDLPADRAALGAAGFPDVEAVAADAGAAAGMRPGLL
eukprot:13823167-Alexandrium_andersonii.AAC.1